MDLVSLGKEALQNIAEYAASYRLGQSVLRQLDRGLWIVEKCARWAVPPPLDQDERPQPELVRPLPWVFFLMMLLMLRVARETVSLANLLMGKPPLRSADVVTFIQSKRRYLRALKYQGNRVLRSRTTSQDQPWYSGIYSRFQLTMCFRRESNYGNNNTTRVTNNDEVVVIKRKPRGRQEEVPVTPTESTMERLIEKMMVDLDAESDDDSTYDLANASQKDLSDLPESDLHNSPVTPNNTQNKEMSQTNGDDIHFSPNKNENSSSTPEKEENDVKTENIEEHQEVEADKEEKESQVKENNVTNEYKTANSDDFDANANLSKESVEQKLNENISESAYTGNSVAESSSAFPISENLNSVNHNSENSNNVNHNSENSSSVNQNSENLNSIHSNSENLSSANSNSVQNVSQEQNCEDSALLQPEEKKERQAKEETQKFIKSETLPQISQKTSKNKIVNGRVKSVPNKKKGAQRESRDSNEVPQQRVLPSNASF